MEGKEKLFEEIKAEEVLFNRRTKDFLKRHRKGERIPKEEGDLHVEHRKKINELCKLYDRS